MSSLSFTAPDSLEGKQDHTISHKCGHCSKEVAGIIVSQNMGVPVRWLACPNCKRGSVLNIDTFAPEPLLGDDVKGLPETIQHAYTEARKTFSFECYTACNLLCRKILMNVAVDKGGS